MNDFRSADVSNPLSVGGPHNVTDTHIVVGDRRLRSVGKPSDNEIASFLCALLFTAPTSHNGHPLSVRRRDKVPAATRLAPCRIRRSARCGDLPQISLMRKINAVSVF